MPHRHSLPTSRASTTGSRHASQVRRRHQPGKDGGTPRWRAGSRPASVRMDGYRKARRMRGTMVCGVVDTCEGRAAGAVAVGPLRTAWSPSRARARRRGRRPGGQGNWGGVARSRGRRAQRRRHAERREAYGDAATRLGQIAAEEAADLILVGPQIADGCVAGSGATLPRNSRPGPRFRLYRRRRPAGAERGRRESRSALSSNHGTRSIRLFWRIFAINATLLALVALLLIVTPIEISAPIAPIQARSSSSD